MRDRDTVVLCLAAALLLAAGEVTVHGSAAPVEDLLALGADAPVTVAGGTLETALEGGRAGWRWRIALGETSQVSLRPDSELFSRLRSFDRLQIEYRIVSGRVNAFELEALGHVSGPRQYKVHNFRIAIATTRASDWQRTELDLGVPYWFPWDNPDGEGEEGYFRLQAMAIEPDTVIELRALRLVRGLIYRKPDYELPVTWPVASNAPDGAVTYTLTHKVLNTSGRPAEIRARIVSRHARFGVALDKAAEEVKSGGQASFTVTATLSAAAIGALPELYAEPLEMEFGLAHRPEVTSWWSGLLVRPLSPDVRRQAFLAEGDLAYARERLAQGDAAFRELAGFDRTLARADEFLGKALRTIPRSYSHVRNAPVQGWKVGDAMSEAVSTETGETRANDELAGRVWREYLGNTDQAPHHLGLAYLLTRDERYAAKGIELLGRFAEQYAERDWRAIFDVPWYHGAPIQGSSRLASNSSYGSNWELKPLCRMASMIADSPSWTEEQRRLVYLAFVLPYATELTKLPAQISNQVDITNHNLLLLGLAFRDPLMVYMATRRDCGLVSRLEDITPDGFSSEGRPLNYHSGAANEYLPSLCYLANSGLKLDFGLDRVLAAIRMPYYRATLTGRVPNAGDCGRGQSVGPSYLAGLALPLAPDRDWLLDVARGGGLATDVILHKAGRKPDANAWRRLLDARPHLFPDAGLAILRSGDAPEDQVMVTLDYGRNVFHGARDRNQITLCAFGKVYTHGQGSLYNAGSGGILKSDDARLKSFISGAVSLSQNVLIADQTSQELAVGKLLAWSDVPARQVAVSSVSGIYPGVTHTRGVVLTDGLVMVLDRVHAEGARTFDLVYHNFGEISLGAGWTRTPCKPLGQTGNYENIIDPAEAADTGPFRAVWNLANQYPAWEGTAAASNQARNVSLAFWQTGIPGAAFYTGSTGLNNPNTAIVPDSAPTVIQRAVTNAFDAATILEPFKDRPRVAGLAPAPGGGWSVRLADGREIAVSLDALIEKHAVRR